MILLVICNWSVQSSCWRGWGGGGHSSYLMKFSRVKLFISMPVTSNVSFCACGPFVYKAVSVKTTPFFGFGARDFLCRSQRQLTQVAAYIALHLNLPYIKNLILDNSFHLRMYIFFQEPRCHHFFHCFRLEVVYLVN